MTTPEINQQLWQLVDDVEELADEISAEASWLQALTLEFDISLARFAREYVS